MRVHNPSGLRPQCLTFNWLFIYGLNIRGKLKMVTTKFNICPIWAGQKKLHFVGIKAHALIMLPIPHCPEQDDRQTAVSDQL